MSSKKNILERISKGKSSNHSVEAEIDRLRKRADSNYFPKIEADLLDNFANELQAIGGKVFICADEAEFVSSFAAYCKDSAINGIYVPNEQLAEKISDAGLQLVSFKEEDGAAVLTECECIISRTGSVLMSSKINGGRKVLSFAEKHLIFAREDQLVEEIKQALLLMKEKYPVLPSQITMVTGQSRTADIEKTLVMGAHGPKELAVFVVRK